MVKIEATSVTTLLLGVEGAAAALQFRLLCLARPCYLALTAFPVAALPRPPSLPILTFFCIPSHIRHRPRTTTQARLLPLLLRRILARLLLPYAAQAAPLHTTTSTSKMMKFCILASLLPCSLVSGFLVPSPPSARAPLRASAAVMAAAAEPVVETLAGKKPEYIVMEDASGRSINTTMVAYLKQDGKRYCLGTPVDSPMVLMDSGGRPIDPSNELTEKMFYQLDDYFTNKGYEILHTAGFLTIAGEPDWFDDDDVVDEDEIDSDDEYDSEDEEEEDEVEVAAQAARSAAARGEDSVRVDPICDVEFEGSMYRIVQLLDRVPLSAEEDGEGKWRLVSDPKTHLGLEKTAKK